MNTRGGKGYFYSMGARDKHLGLNCTKHCRYNWPTWAFHAYNAGWAGFGL